LKRSAYLWHHGSAMSTQLTEREAKKEFEVIEEGVSKESALGSIKEHNATVASIIDKNIEAMNKERNDRKAQKRSKALENSLR